jgi:hypothetical protein
MHGGHQPHPQQYQPPYGQQGFPGPPQQLPAAPYMPAPQQYPPVAGQPQVYSGPLPGGDPKAQAWKNYGMQWLLGLGFLAVIVVFVTIYNLATGEW